MVVIQTTHRDALVVAQQFPAHKAELAAVIGLDGKTAVSRNSGAEGHRFWRRKYLSSWEAATHSSTRLLQCNFACEDTVNNSCILHTFVDDLLLFVLVAILLHPQIKNFLCQTVERGEVLVTQPKTNVPIIRV